MSDTLFKQLQEELQEDEWLHFWKTYGPAIAGLVVLALVSGGGYLWWQSREEKARGVLSALYEQAVDHVKNHQEPEARALFQKLAHQKSRGYSLLARLQLVALDRQHALETQTPEAIARLDQTGKALLGSGIGARYTWDQWAVGMTLASAALDLDHVFVGTEPLLDAAIAPQNPWRGLALEMRALKEAAQGNVSRAPTLKAFAPLLADDIPQALRARAQMELIGLGFGFRPLPPQRK